MTERWTAEQYRNHKSSGKKHKYNAKKTEIDGITFDSQKEADYYCQLKLLKKSGKIKDFALQPKYELQPAFEKDGKKFRPITYIADFLITYNDGSTEIVDIKGIETKDFRLKKKMFEYRFPDLKLTISNG